MKRLLWVLPFAMLFGCSEIKPDADDIQRKATTELTKEAQSQVGMPSITNFAERKLMKRILELRDDPKLITYTYIVTLDGKLVFLTKSMGYGLPYATQFTNPERIDYYSSGSNVIPQPDPNGLFMPSSADATWIIAINDDGSTEPMYVEPTVIVSPKRLH